jgi:hypothetical protein
MLPLILLGALILLLVVLRRGRGTAPPSPPADAPKAPVAPEDPTFKLMQLKQMLDDGYITEADYEAKKAEILADM